MHNGFNQVEDAPRGHTRVISRARDMQPQRLNINLIVTQMSRTLEHVLGRDVILEILCEQDLPPFLGVTNMVKLAVMDLCATSRSAIRGGGKLTISTALKSIEQWRAGRPLDAREADYICISIRHVATEANEAELDRNSRHNLATVYGIAQQHCGWLEVSHADGSGASFDLYFPVASKSLDEFGHDDQTVEIPGGRETILLVEDEVDLLSLTREVLERYGYKIIAAPNGVAALKAWSEKRKEIDLLLTDMRMPEGISGHELAERLTSEKPNLKVIYVSGYSIEGLPPMKLREGDNFLTKPYTPPGLAQVVRKMLDCPVAARAI